MTNALQRVRRHAAIAAGLAVLTVLAMAVQGYHMGADDAAIYLPGIRKIAEPSLYPFGQQFFETHAHLSLFSNLVGGAARLLPVTQDWTIFGCQVLGVFLLLAAAWRLASACFENSYARWAGVALLAAALTVPVAGTALVIADPYVTARTLSTPATLFALAEFLHGRRVRAGLWLVFAAAIHPQMAVYCTVLLAAFFLPESWNAMRTRMPERAGALSMTIPFLFNFRPATGAAAVALHSRTYFFVTQWAWYEWIGIVAPLAIFAWLGRAKIRGTRPAFGKMCRAMIPFGVLFTAAALGLVTTARLENYTRLQPMRAFHLVYVVMFVLLGGLAGEYALRLDWRRWAALFVPLGILLAAMQVNAYPASAHVEWPGVASGNQWVAAFLWIRDNTPRDALFAMDPKYLQAPGEDGHGFRAIAERSVLADELKDSGAVSLFPQLAPEWASEANATRGWGKFQAADFQRLERGYPVKWVVVSMPAPAGLTCPFEDRSVAVCPLDATIRGAGGGAAAVPPARQTASIGGR